MSIKQAVRSLQGRASGPYAPSNQGLGGSPEVLPDIPITAVFLLLYVIFTPIHFRILKTNKSRGHKFLFSGALFGFCKVRLITMSVRIAWACYPRNISLGIAAQVFVYAGTIILFFTDWFFLQRIIRAQHPRWGWSQPYRIFHRAGLICLILSLLMIIVTSIQPYFTQSTTIRRIDRDLQLAGQTYFAAFCFAPIPILLISLALPRKGTEKFGAGRLRNAIVILLVAATILSVGAIFRCVIQWLPPVSLRNAQGQSNATPWYFSKACFYVFNFAIEIFVVIFFAVTRVDLRFHIADGAKGPGAYKAGRDSKYNIGVIGDEKNLKRASSQKFGESQINNSNDTLHEFNASLFDDTRTLADSLRYPSSVLEVDSKTGHWKVKRVSGAPSIHSAHLSSASQPSLWSPDRDTYVASDAPPLPTDWPLRESQFPAGSIPLMEHRNQSNMSITKGDAISDAIAQLEANSELGPKRSGVLMKDQPPDYEALTPHQRPGSAGVAVQPAQRPGSDIRPKHTYSPSQQPGSDIPRKHNYSPNPRRTSGGNLPKKQSYTPPPVPALTPRTSGSDLPRKVMPVTSSSDLPKKQNYEPLPYEPVPQTPTSPTFPQETHSPQTPQTLRVSRTSQQSDSNSYNTAEEEFRRFSFEAPPRRGEEGYEGSLNESERELERKSLSRNNSK
ncbi:hypothetical protein K491DRAFT_674154 [Lophiostoma macrostomum CBS 122681]|uniref:Uncharacterized protein n=1 Tax=Lophiostoma macrostomum CBS 122681 TaxID=1314788 RepID=A0A6A6TM92_9PLEO|nr:hypothetical protein K491DRAFT_674154 [Lophiostoma macrostomum CBS 122681]